MKIQFNDPATDFSNGLFVIKAYHEDFLRRGKALLKLIQTIQQHGIDEQLAGQCVETFWHYNVANLLHHRDEEAGVFPLMLGLSALTDGMMERLLLDHEEIEKAWAKLANFLSHPERIDNADYLLHVAEEFERLQREHLNREDEDFAPRVKELLSEEQLQALGSTLWRIRHPADEKNTVS